MVKAACPKCKKVFDSPMEYRLHWSHDHYGTAPKPITQPTPTEETPTTAPTEEPQTTESPTEAYSLAISCEGLGELYPVLRDAHGNIIDGRHRKDEKPDWHEAVCSQIDTPIKLAFAKLAVHGCRRDIPPEETKETITFLAKEGITASQIRKGSGIGLTTIYKYMPQSAKNQVKIYAGKASGEARSNSVPLAEQDKRKPSLNTTSIPTSTPSTAFTPSTKPQPAIPQTEEPEENEGDDINHCPCCQATLDPNEYQTAKKHVAQRYGAQIQTLLFPPTQKKA